MKKSTKILLILFITTLIPLIFLSKSIFMGVVPVDNKLTFNFDTKAIIGLCFLGVNILLGGILFFKFLSILTLDKVLFFTSAPLVLSYGILLFFLAYLNSSENNFAKAIKSLLNISGNNTYNLILWIVILSMTFVLLLFLNYIIICRPVTKVERIVTRLGDGMVREGRLYIGGGKQFSNIEHSLNKINNNYRESEGEFGGENPIVKKGLNKQFLRLFGRSGITELERGNEIKKRVALMGVKLVKSSNKNEETLEENFNIVNSYFNLISPIIRKHGGYIDKYVGDGIVAVFSRNENSIECAHAICKAIDIKNKQHHSLPDILIRISLVYDSVIFGMTNVNDRKMPSIISNTNVLYKLDELCRFMSIKVIFAKSLIDELPLNFRFKYRYVGSVFIDNKNVFLFEDLEVYTKEIKERLFKTKSYFEKAVMQYEKEEYQRALVLFEEALKEFSNDRASYVYYNKAKEKLE